MNLNAMKALCNGGKRATVLNGQLGSQWITNGFGAWLVEGITIEDAFALEELFGLTEKARAKAVIMVRDTEDPRFSVVKLEDEEELNERTLIGFGESAYIGLESERGMLYIDAALVRPMRNDYRHYYCRWKDGRPMVAVYDDLMTCKTLIMPTSDIIAEHLREEAKKLAAPVFHWPDEKKEAEDAAADAEAAAEMLFTTDTETSSGADAPPSPEGKATEDEGDDHAPGDD